MACVVALAATMAANTATVEWRCSVEGKTWQLLQVEESAVPTVDASSLLVQVNTSAAQHEIEGFGGCFNEKGWDALSVLDEQAKHDVLQNLFGEQGLRYGLNR